MDPDPIAQVERWREEAASHEPVPFTPMVLATVDSEGRPSSRNVILKATDERGFVFYTNYRSRKARELEGNPHASMTMRFLVPHRQVVVRGRAERVSEPESDAYWATRPRGSQLGAWASDQSEVIPSREVLESRLEALQRRWPEGTDIPRPPHWGGYVVRPDEVEFWEDRLDRLHDRHRYRRDGDRWVIERLAP